LTQYITQDYVQPTRYIDFEGIFTNWILRCLWVRDWGLRITISWSIRNWKYLVARSVSVSGRFHNLNATMNLSASLHARLAYFVRAVMSISESTIHATW